MARKREGAAEEVSTVFGTAHDHTDRSDEALRCGIRERGRGCGRVGSGKVTAPPSVSESEGGLCAASRTDPVCSQPPFARLDGAGAGAFFARLLRRTCEHPGVGPLTTLAWVTAYGAWNLVMDAATLYLAHRALARHLTWRIAVGAVLGTAYAFVPGRIAGGLIGHLLALGAMCAVGGVYDGLRALATLWTACLGASLAVGGVALALATWVGGHVPSAAHPAPGYTALVAVAALLATERLRAAYRVRRWAEEAARGDGTALELEIRIGPNAVHAHGLIDTGNRLTDPLTARPVLIVSPETWTRLCGRTAGTLGEAQRQDASAAATEKPLEGRWAVMRVPPAGDLTALPPAERLHLVPYRSVGGEGLLLALRPDAVWVEDLAGRRRPLGSVLVGRSPTPLMPGVECIVPAFGAWSCGTVQTTTEADRSVEGATGGNLRMGA